MRGAIAATRVPAGLDPGAQDAAAGGALDALKELGPRNGAEGMLAGLAVALNEAAVGLLGRATRAPDLSPEVAARLFGMAARLADSAVAVDAALLRRQGHGSRQHVVVEHLTVHDGGRAVVAAVAGPAAGRGGGRA